MNHLDEENVYETNFKVFKTLTLIMTSLTAKLGRKGPEFVNYVAIVIESKSITIQYLMRAIHFSGQKLRNAIHARS